MSRAVSRQRGKSALSSGWREAVPYALLACCVFIAYSNIYGSPFLADDEIWIVHNQFLRSWRHLPALFGTTVTAGSNYAGTYYRPLQILLYLIVFQAVGLAPYAFHLLNVCLHAANACLVYRLGCRLGFKTGAVFVASMLWALHPVQTEGVIYINALIDPLYSLFCLLGILVLLPDFAPRRFFYAVPLMLLGILSKETAIIFPLLAMSCFYLVSKKRLDLMAYTRFWPLIGVAVVYVVLRFVLAPPHGTVASGGVASHVGAYGPFAALTHFALLLIWPAHLHMEHDLPAYAEPWHAAVLAGFGLIALGMLQLQRTQSRKGSPLSWGLLWFAAAYLPTAIVGTRFFEHWLYLPLAGLFLGIAQTVALQIEALAAWKRKIALQVATVAAVLVIGLFAILTFWQSEVWQEPVAFYENIFKYGELSPGSHINFGAYYAERGDYQNALEQYQLAIEKAKDSPLSPASVATVETDWGVTLLMMPGRNDAEAIMHLQRALDADPHCFAALDALAGFYGEKGEGAKSDEYRSRADVVRKNLMTYSEASTPNEQ